MLSRGDPSDGEVQEQALLGGRLPSGRASQEGTQGGDEQAVRSRGEERALIPSGEGNRC